MIQRKEVKALVCLGGKIKEYKKDEGIREEIELAREMNIPVFEYSCAMKSHFRKSGNQMSGKWKSSHASLLA